MKFCQVGSHYVSHLWHREKPDRPSACKNCAPKSNLQRVTPIQQEAYKPQREAINKAITAPKSKLEDKPLAALKELLQIHINRYVRKRDRNMNSDDFTCICCGVRFPLNEMDAGHYISVKHQSTRFDLINLNGQSQACNRLEYGRQKEYRERLVSIYGEQEILDLEARSREIKKWTKEEILALIQKYKSWP